MVQTRGFIAGRKIIASGSLVIFEGEKAKIYPLPADPEFCLSFEFPRSRTGSDTIDVDVNGEKEAVIRFKRPIDEGLVFSPSGPMIFASEDDGSVDYYVSIGIARWGDETENTTIVNYTVTSAPPVGGR